MTQELIVPPGLAASWTMLKQRQQDIPAECMPGNRHAFYHYSQPHLQLQILAISVQAEDGVAKDLCDVNWHIKCADDAGQTSSTTGWVYSGNSSDGTLVSPLPCSVYASSTHISVPLTFFSGFYQV